MTAQEAEAIERTMQLYIDGARDGDAARLREAFHPDARMFGSMAGQRYDTPISEYFAMADGSPADTAGNYKARITSIE